MRTDPPSLCERQFTIEGFRQGLRQDERRPEDFRQVGLVLSKQRGVALCTLGNTKVMCAVSASICEPGQSRPHKGVITVEVDMSPMASPAHEASRLGNKGLELTRLLELVLRDSRCIDTEALCIRARAEVWKLRVDVRVLDDDGALVDCASVAAAAALHHYARPDVTVHQQHTQIHTEWEKALVPLNIYHMPICVTFGFSKEAGVVVMDPLEREQLYLDGSLVVACNKRREVCVMHQANSLTLTTAQITACVQHAMTRCLYLSELVSTVIADEARRRARGETGAGFETAVTADLLTSRETHPNELIAPAVAGCIGGATAVPLGEAQVKEENALAEGATEMEEGEERKLLEEQVGAIATEVRAVGIADNVQSTSAAAVKASGKSRKQDMADLDDLLDDLDGETMVLGGGEATPTSTQAPPTPGGDDAFDLVAAKKKKKK